jgi:AcrR family transcriptional regulator
MSEIQAQRSSKRKTQRQGPGRPEGVSNSHERILKAAEDLFSKKGYSGTSLREIGEKCRVTTALITYYFKSKESLLETIVLRIGEKLEQQRLKHLADLKEQNGPVSVRNIVRALILPLMGMPDTPATRRFMRIQSWLHSEPEPFAFQLRAKLYEKTNEKYIQALSEALPHLSKKTIYWRFMLTVGCYLYASSDTHRLSQMSNKLCNPDDLEELLDELTDFICGGLVAESTARSQ